MYCVVAIIFSLSIAGIAAGIAAEIENSRHLPEPEGRAAVVFWVTFVLFLIPYLYLARGFAASLPPP